MPLIQSKSKKAFSHNVKAEMDSGKPQDQSLAIAYNIKRKSSKKMAAGGEVKNPELEQSYMEPRPSSIAEAIMRKNRMANGGEVEPDNEESSNLYDDLNVEAASEDLYDEHQLSSQPEDSNEHSDNIESDSRDMVSQIRRKLRSQRGF